MATNNVTRVRHDEKYERLLIVLILRVLVEPDGKWMMKMKAMWVLGPLYAFTTAVR